METRVCRKCGEEKDVDKFSFSDKAKVYRRWRCDSCESERGKNYNKNNSESRKIAWKSYKDKNKEKLKVSNKNYHAAHAKELYQKRKEYGKKYKADNRSELLKKKRAHGKLYYQKNWDRARVRREDNKEKHKSYCKTRYKEKRLELLAKNKIYRKNNIGKNRITKGRYQKTYSKNKRKTDALFKLRCNLRSRTTKAFKAKAYKKNGTTENMLGAAYPAVKKHIESLFEPWMTWENHGEWQIDHILPLSSAKSEAELINLCHYTNLQPLLKAHNMSKGAKLDYAIPSSDQHYCRIQRPD